MGEMETAEILSLVSIGSFIGAGIFFILAVILFVKFRIPSVIGDLSGRTARKSMEEMRKNNGKTGRKSYKSSETEELLSDPNETVLLKNETKLYEIETILMIHTDEVIG